jgi:acyl-coenzyme A thioesterase PaaI-like protein
MTAVEQPEERHVATGMELIEAIRDERAQPPSGIITLGLDVTHRWLVDLRPGHVELDWPVDDRHLNLEGAVICSWVAAVGDQAVFFATTSQCGAGESTRMLHFELTSHHNILPGTVRVVANVVDRIGGVFHASCEFRLSDGRVAATMAATVGAILPMIVATGEV